MKGNIILLFLKKWIDFFFAMIVLFSRNVKSMDFIHPSTISLIVPTHLRNLFFVIIDSYWGKKTRQVCLQSHVFTLLHYLSKGVKNM